MKKATGAEFPGHKGVNSRSHVRKPVREYNDWQLKTNQPKQSSKSDGYQISIIDKCYVRKNGAANSPERSELAA